MNTALDNGILTISLSGRIDSSNASDVEEQIAAAREANAHDELVLDLEGLEYISSAGLRVVLRLLKQEPQMKLVNACSEVYEIFDMTGFTEMTTVEKAYRALSVEGCEVIGRGANGTVYRIDRDTVVKVYRNADCLPDVQRERELARKAFVLGIPTAIPYDVVRVGDSYGSVFELLNSRSFSKLIAANPEDIDTYVGLYVDLMKQLHSTTVSPDDMPNMKTVALDWVNFLRDYLPAGQAEKLVALVEAVPERHTMLHGDYHNNNIVMQNDEVLIIDMDTLCYGHPIFELASMYLAFVAFGEVDCAVTESFLKLAYDTAGVFWHKSLSAYLGTQNEDAIRAVEEKAMVVGYARLMRRTIRRDGLDTEEGRSTIELCRARLADLLPRVDTLEFS